MVHATATLSRPAAPTAFASGSFERWVSFILLATPALFALVSFPATSDLGVAARRFSFAVRVAEVLIIICAMRDGFSIAGTWGRLSTWTKFASTLWIVSVGVAAVFAERDPALAIMLAPGTILHGLVALALYDRLQVRPAASLVALLRSAAIGLACYAVAAVYCQALVADQRDFPWFYFGAGVTNVRQIGFYGLPLVGSALGLLALADSDRDRRTSLVLLFAGFFLVIWCGGRGSVIGALVAVCVALLFATGQRWRLLSATALCAALATPLAHVLSRSPEYGPASLLRFLGQSSGTGMDGYSSSRVQFWQWTWEDILKQPLIGHGEGQFASMIYDHAGAVFNHPHNSILQVMYEWGVPGFCAIALLLGGTMLRAVRLRGEHLAYALPAIAGLAALAATSLLDGSLYYPMPLLSAFLFLAVIESQAAAMKNRHSP